MRQQQSGSERRSDRWAPERPGPSTARNAPDPAFRIPGIFTAEAMAIGVSKMTQSSRKALGVLALLWAFVGQASAQVLIYERNPFYGAGSTPQGDMLRGEGIFLNGAGLYNYYSSVAQSINVSTMIGLNEYIY